MWDIVFCWQWNTNVIDRFITETLRLCEELAKTARVCQKLHKYAHWVYKSFKSRQTGRSTEFPVSSGCCCIPFLSIALLSLFRFLAKEQNFLPIHMYLYTYVFHIHIYVHIRLHCCVYDYLQSVLEFDMTRESKKGQILLNNFLIFIPLRIYYRAKLILKMICNMWNDFGLNS